MRGNSGKDESRDNLHDPTLRDRDLIVATQQAQIRSPKRRRIIGANKKGKGFPSRASNLRRYGSVHP